jgi:phosphoribosylanthranilate isomerase
LVHVKICGVTTASDARACVELGASSIGINFVASSPRRIELAKATTAAREIARAAHAASDRVVVVGVVADMTLDDMRALAAAAELDCLQLHGGESHETLAALLPHAYKAARIATAEDVEHARAFPGEHLLVDAKVEGLLGGSGSTFDWRLVEQLARERRLTLAGGLTPGNVERAVREIAPYCVDTASGVEPPGAPGIKDLGKVRAFIEASRAASGA